MRAVFAILAALSQAVRRDLASFESLKLNNLVLFVFLLIWGALQSGVEPVSAEPLILLLVLLLLFPLSSTPLSRIPADRFKSWPIDSTQRFVLAATSLALSPILWIAIGILAFSKQWLLAIFFVATAVFIQALSAVSAEFGIYPLRHLPPFPGKLGGLLQNNLREIASVLDLYAALLLCCGGIAYRTLAPQVDAMASPLIAMLVALTLSTFSQCLFGLNLESSAMLRYRLLPLRGWEILLAKDATFLGVLTVLCLPFDLCAGLTFGLVSVAIGHHTSLLVWAPQRRWRFTGGRVFPGVLQGIFGTMLAFATVQRGRWVMLSAVALFALSLWFYGRVWDRQSPG